MAPSAVARWLGPVFDLVFPVVCPVCRIRSDDGGYRPFCAACWRALPLLDGPACRVCGTPLAGLGADETCPACRRGRPPIAFVRAVAAYRDGMRTAIHALKYQRRRALAAPLGRLLADAGSRLLPGPPAQILDAIVPVPLHPLRLAQRGFNQAELLAAPCAARWGVPFRPHALARARATQPQTALDATARQANVAGAFTVARPSEVRGRRLLLVDDVLTTGATVTAAVDSLRRGGAVAVGVLVLARVGES